MSPVEIRVNDKTAPVAGEVFLGDPIVREVAPSEDDVFAKSAKHVRGMAGISPTFKRKTTRAIEKVASSSADAKSKKIEVEALTGYLLFDVVVPPYNLDYLSKLYELSPPHYAAVRAKVANIVGLGHDFVESPKIRQALAEADTEEKKKKITSKVQRAKLQMEEWLDSCNDDDDFSETLRKVWTDYEVTGNGYLEIGRTVNGDIGYIGHMPATLIRVRKQRDGFVQIFSDKVVFFRNFGTNTDDPFGNDPRPNEIIHFKKYSPTNSFYGVPDVIAAKAAVAGEEFASRYNLEYFENKAVPRYVIVVKGANLSPRSQQQIVEFFETGLKGKHHRTIYIPLPADETDRKVSFEMKAVESGTQDASFVNYHTINQASILMVHGVPLSKVTSGAGISLAAARDADKTFKEGICRPEQSVAEKKINKIIKEKTDVFLFKLNELSLTDEDTQSKIDERAIRNQWAVPNEVRARQGKPALPGGDKVVEQSPQKVAEAKAQTTNSRQRTQDRTANASDSAGEARQAKGDGRATA